MYKIIYLKKNIILYLFCFIVMSQSIVYAEEAPVKLIFGDDLNYPPFSYIDANGQPAGYNVELAKAISEALGYDYEIRLDEWHKVRSMLESGEIDIITGMFYTDDRAELYDFTNTHSVLSGDIFTLSGVQIDSLESLSGARIAVQKGDVVEEYLQSTGYAFELISVPTVKEALDLLIEGEVKYAGLLKIPGLYVASELGYETVKAQNLGFIAHNYAMAVKEGNEEMRLAIDGGLRLIKATGEYEVIHTKWLGVYEAKGIVYFYERYKWVILGIIGLFGLLIINNIFMRILVNRKTKAVNQLNQTLIQSENKSRAIINALPDIVFTINGEGEFIDVKNSDAHEVYYPEDHLVGKKINVLLSDKYSSQCMRAIKLALGSGSVQTLEYEIQHHGKPFYYEMRLVKSRGDEVVAIARNITADKERRDYVEYLSYHDQLTGLYNRRFFVEELKRLDVERNYPLCLIMADVNGLKLINDSFGHTVGDELLIKVADVLKEACREDEIISRIGGDEFVILVPNMPSAHAEVLIDRVKAISKTVNVNSIDISVSFGWAVKEKSSQSIDEIFNEAEDLMYSKKLVEGPTMRGKTIDKIIETIYAKNDIEKKHAENVARLCKAFAKSLDLPNHEIEEIKTIALLHDIGKIAIKDEILNKAGPLTQSEREDIQKHSEIGYRILSSVNDLAEEAEVVLHHHERYDGKGYPMGLAGEAIPFRSRLLAIVDSYDAMTNERPYKRKMTIEEAKAEIKAQSGKQFDPRLADWFLTKIIPNT
ncbi:HD domain-containing phosphohydrolase [Fusibacter tunisiensis]|uniref:Diguanylate cyclase (GGDEF)-like protein/PAS domain S-box-containing protein n=1 Tax=Fusibacter tunisiensis TaxID=1008308 RepID=A0ABS2MSR3_9FIRM|nr:transporter substrate-binding domain-containing protein [Fusibacter tunisiensis]MBM7562464.1 diguanylate cyclase (GGDEF)-like protein/PAS domain S-box-containing protein [Fusibacter tunisiensis]